MFQTLGCSIHVRPNILMSKTDMYRIQTIFNALKPIAIAEADDKSDSFLVSRQKVKSWQQRCRLRPKIGKYCTS